MNGFSVLSTDRIIVEWLTFSPDFLRHPIIFCAREKSRASMLSAGGGRGKSASMAESVDRETAHTIRLVMGCCLVVMRHVSAFTKQHRLLCPQALHTT